MEGFLVGDSSVNRVWPPSVTKEAVMSLKNKLVSFERAASLLNVDLPTFKAKLFEFNILVWKDADGIPVRIHGGPYKIHMVINKIHFLFVVEGTHPFYVVRNMIETSFCLTNGSYTLTYEQPQTSKYKSLNTDLDWHYAVECSKVRGLVRLTMKSIDHRIVTIMNAYDGLLPSNEQRPYDNFAFSSPVINIIECILSPSDTDKLFANIDRTIADKLKGAAIGKVKKRVAFDGAQLPLKKCKTMSACDEYGSYEYSYEPEFHESDYDDSF